MKKLLLIIAISFLLFSCGTEQSDKSEAVDSTMIADTIREGTSADSVKTAKSDYSFLEIIKALPENEKDLDYNQSFLENYEAIQESKSKMIKSACEQGMFPNSVSCPDTAYFAWKMSIREFTLVCFMTIDWNAKGPSVMYHLMTVENSTGASIAFMPDWAASYSFAVENPNGGTSAGVRYVPGSLTNNPIVRISTKDEDENDLTVELSPDGFFVEPYAQFNADTNLQ